MGVSKGVLTHWLLKSLLVLAFLEHVVTGRAIRGPCNSCDTTLPVPFQSPCQPRAQFPRLDAHVGHCQHHHPSFCAHADPYL